MEPYNKLDDRNLQELRDMANKLRLNVIRATNEAKSGHPTSCSSIAEVMAVLFFNTMRFKVSSPRDPSCDRLVLSKGHAATVLYAAWAEAGLFPVSELLNTRKIDSDLEGHPTPRLSFVDVATGSLGQGLSVACGMAYVGKYVDKASFRVYCVVGDGESAEGAIWEALSFAGHYKLDNLCVIFDVNRLGQSDPCPLQHNMEIYRRRMEAFGLYAIVVDGHDVESLCEAFHKATVVKCIPTAILAKTFKGRNFPGIENEELWHGKVLKDKCGAIENYIASLIKNKGPTELSVKEPTMKSVSSVDITNIKLGTPLTYNLKDLVATRVAYGDALLKICTNNKHVIALDGDTKNSTYSIKVRRAFPEQFIECFIAEQNLVGVAFGAACRGRTVPFVSTFAAFLTRAFDQIRMGGISQVNVKFAGSHCGVSIGADGPSQMGLEDIAMFRTIPGSTVFYPSDAVSCERAVELAANTKGICFIRTSRPVTEVLYNNDEVFEVGKAKVLKQSDTDKVLVIGGGVTIKEVLLASVELANSGVNIRVMDLFTVKPIDKEAIVRNAKESGSRIVTVEDHYPQGGIGEAVLSAVADEPGILVKKMAVEEIPRSGPGDMLLEKYGISASCIVKTVQTIVTN